MHSVGKCGFGSVIRRGTNRRRSLCLAALGLALVPGAVRAASQTSTFVNGTGLWSNPASWSPAGVPNNSGTTYNVVFNGADGVDTLKLDENITINQYTMSGGFLTWKTSGTAFTLTLDDTLNWSGGTIGGANVLATQGGSIAASSTCIVGSGTLTNQGTITYTATFNSTPDNQLPLRLDSNGAIVNSAGATFNIAGDGGISVTSSTAHFDNNGLFEKTAGTGTSVIESAFNDTGTVSIQSGTLQFIGHFNTHSGIVQASAGATVGVGGTSTFTSTSTFGGDGTLQFLSDSVSFGGKLLGGAGPLIVQGNSQAAFVAGANVAALGQSAGAGGRALQLVGQGTLSFNTGQAVSINSLSSNNNFTPQSNVSIVINGSDDLTLNGPSNWTGGMFAGASSGAINNLTVNAPMAISGGGMALDHRNLQNNSTITWSGGYLQVKNGSVITNAAGATINIQTDTNLGWGPTLTGFALPSINNAGLIVKSAGTGETQINDVRLTNTGTVRVESGTLTLNYGESNGNFQGYTDSGVNSGIYQIDQGAKMAVSGQTMDASSTVQGAGTMEFRANNTVAGNYNMTGQTNVVNGVAFVAGAKVTNVGQLLNITPSGGASFDTGSPITLNNLVNNGSLTGSDTITITGKFSGAGTTSATIAAPGTIAPGNSPGIMTLQGKLTMTSTTNVVMELAGNLNNSTQTDYDAIASSNPLTIGGNLQLSLVNGYVPTSGDTLPIITDNSALSGSFTNVAPGARLMTADGTGSFIVDYGAASPFGSDNVVLANFQATPEPVGASLMFMFGGGLLLRRRRAK